MKVFITGGSGFVGSHIVKELSHEGYKVVALARTEASAAKLKNISSDVEVLRGELTDLNILKKGARESDGVLHLGFIHDFSNFDECCRIDRKAVDAMLEALEGTNHPFVYTSGTLQLPIDRISDESSSKDESRPFERANTEEATLAYKDKGVRAQSIRLPPSVHGNGDKGFIPTIISSAKKNNVSVYIGEGDNFWTTVHVSDAAHLYRLALEKGRSGHAYHAVAEWVTTKSIAEAIAKKNNVSTVSIVSDKAFEYLGFLGIFFSWNNRVSSEKTRSELSWKPKNVTLLEDISYNYNIK